MKKFIANILLVLSLSVPTFAASSDDIYVRRDVFDVHMMNINQNLEKISNRLDKIEVSINELSKAVSSLSEKVSALSERVDGNFAVLATRIDATNIRIDDLRNGLYLWLVVIGTFIAWPKAKDFFQNRAAQRKFLTLQDVEKLIDSKLNSKSQ